MAKVPFDPDKKNWHPSVLPGQIVLVTTIDARGEPNVAPKSWVTMAAFGGPVVAFGCTEEHLTLQNVEATGEFVVNVPAEPLADTIWDLIRRHGSERIRSSGLQLCPAWQVRPPLVEQCRAHLECRLEEVKRFGDEAFVFGRVVAASIDGDCLEGTPEEQYFRLRPLFFLEGSTYGSIDTAKHIGRDHPTDQELFVVEIGPYGGDGVEEHVAYLRRVRDSGRLLLAGPYERADGGPTGMYILGVDSAEDAERIAADDPLVHAGADFAVRRWTRTF